MGVISTARPSGSDRIACGGSGLGEFMRIKLALGCFLAAPLLMGASEQVRPVLDEVLSERFPACAESVGSA